LFQKLGNFPKIRKYASIDKYLHVFIPRVLRTFKKRGKEVVGEGLCRNDYASTIITSGMYYYHITKWLKLFNQTQLMIIDGEKYLQDPGTILEKVQEFIGVPKLLWKEDFVKHPETDFFCYREMTEKELDDMSAKANISLQCLPKEKGRSRNGVVTMSNESRALLQEFYAPYNKMFYDAIGKTFTWA